MEKTIDYKALAEALVEKSRCIYSIDITKGKTIEAWWKDELEMKELGENRNYQHYQQCKSSYHGPA